MNTSKKTAFGIFGVAATAALVAGTTMPAFADDTNVSTSQDTTTTKTRILDQLGLSNESPILIAPEVGTGDVLSGNANGNHVGSGNETANGNVVGSGNESVVGSGNTTAVEGIGDVTNNVGDVTANVSDITAHVEDLTGDISNDVNDLLDSVLQFDQD
jgi:hypothetical protein